MERSRVTASYEASEGVGRITLNRPQALNAWNPDLGRALLSCVQRASADDDVRVIVITGAGRAFSAGADVKEDRELTASGDPDLSTRLLTIYNPIVLAVRHAPKPVVAAVNGVAAGIGCSLALACDLVIAAESAYFLWAFTRIGLACDGGSGHFLNERLGAVRAAELMMLGERLPAEKAREWGLVNFVHSDDEFPSEVDQLCGRLANGPSVAYSSIKAALSARSEGDLAESLEFEAKAQQRQASTADYAEGVAAFKEKRPPAFAGH